KPLAIIDNDGRKWASLFHDVKVVSPNEAVTNYPDAAYIVAIFTHTPLRQQLLQLGARRVVSYAMLFHRYPDVFLPYFALDNPSVIAREGDAVQSAAHV